jgi:cell wall-associated NlpC family hydrolase
MGSDSVLESAKKGGFTHAPPARKPGERRADLPHVTEPAAGSGSAGHDFGRVQVARGDSVQPEMGQCPITSTPRTCPFGGACHTCPTRVQAKLDVGQPDDEYEREADDVADKIMRMAEPCCSDRPDDDDKDKVRLKPDSSLIAHHSSPPAGIKVSPEVEAQIQGLHGGGRPLTESERAFCEPHFGQDFSKVRIHADGRAAGAARAVNARAFTVGQDVVFGAGEYVGRSDMGSRLLGHELAHVVQQHRGLAGQHVQRQQAQDDTSGDEEQSSAGHGIAAAAQAEVDNESHYLLGAHGRKGRHSPAKGSGTANECYCHTYPNRGDCTEHKHFDCAGLVARVFIDEGHLEKLCRKEPWTVSYIENHWRKHYPERVHEERDWEGRSAGDVVIFKNPGHIGIYAGSDQVINARGDRCNKPEGCKGKGVSRDSWADLYNTFAAYLDIDWGDESTEGVPARGTSGPARVRGTQLPVAVA